MGVGAGAQALSTMLTPIKIDKTTNKRFIFILLMLRSMFPHRESAIASATAGFSMVVSGFLMAPAVP